MLLVALCFALVAPIVRAENDPDTSSTDRPVAPTKSLGEKMLVIPETVLKSPIYVGKGLAWLAINGIYRNSTAHKLAGYVFAFRPAGGIVPIVSFGSNAGWRYGLSYTRLNIAQSSDRARWVVSHSTNKYRRAEMTYTSPHAFSQTVGLQIAAGYRKRPRESFYGLGNETKAADRSAFTLERTMLQVAVPVRLSQKLQLGMMASYTAVNIADGDTPDWPGSLPELQQKYGMSHADFRSTDILGFELALDHDWRDSKGQPSRGGREELSVSYNHGLGNSDDVWYVVTRGEVSHYIDIYHKRLLAIKVIAQSVDTDVDRVSTLPFYSKSRLGGRTDLRGFLNNRLVDNDLTMATLEYRWPIWSMIDAFIFAEAGRVYSSLGEEFTLKNWHEGYGTGLRIWREENVLVSFQVAFSDEERRIYIELGGEW